MPVLGRCEVVLGEKMEEVKEFKYLGTVVYKHREMEGEIRVRAVKGRCVIGSLARVMRGNNVFKEVMRGLRNETVFSCQYYLMNQRLGHKIRYSNQECMLWK